MAKRKPVPGLIHQIKPSDLLKLAQQGIIPAGNVSLDTETSGLFTDDGARVSTVSIGWEDPTASWTGIVGTDQWAGGVSTNRLESVGTKDSPHQTMIVSMAWPYDQGLTDTGKPEDDGQMGLWPDAENLPTLEWYALLEWLELLHDLHDGPYIDMHHAKFDMHIMDAGLRTVANSGIDMHDMIDWDTQNVASLFWSMHGTTSLKPTCSRIWGDAESDEQAKVKNYLAKKKLPPGRWDLIPWDIIGSYADQDARLTTRLRIHQQYLIRNKLDGKWLDGKDGRLSVEDAVVRRLETSKMLFRMERRGLPFDHSAAIKASREMNRREIKLVKELPFQPPTLPMAKHYWFGEGVVKGIKGLELHPVSVTDKGEAQLNATVVRKLAERGVPGIDTWRNIQKVSTANARWYEGWGNMAGEDGRLRGSVRQNGTRSGRFSISRVQLQAIPHDYRLAGFTGLDGIPTPRQLIAEGVPKGYRLWELDLANAELRVAALMAKCTRMLKLIGVGADLHGDAATQLFNADPMDDDWGQRRGVAKRANFSLIFGVGWVKLQDDIDVQTGLIMRDDETQALVRDWNKLYPEYQREIRKTMGVVETRQKRHGYGWTQMFNGERRWFVPNEETHKGFNQRVQPTLAQYGINWWLEADAMIERELVKLGEDTEKFGLVMLIHDSMVLLLPEGEDERIVKGVQDIGVRLWGETFPGVPGGVDAKQWGSD